MPSSRKTYYDELGVRPRSDPTEIELAWRKYRAQADAPSAAPDRARETRMRAAYETLGDPVKRAEYDRMLAAPRRKQRAKGVMAATLGVVALAGVAAAAYLLQPPPPPAPGTLTVEELTHAASQAMARVDSRDMSGNPQKLGLAFAIDEGFVATSCNGITPFAQLTLYLAPRTVPVKVAQVDEKLGLCKLSATGIGSWPLAVAAGDPSPGDTVYVTKMNAVGEVSLAEAKVKRVVPSDRGKSIEISVAVLPERQGGPVLDARGRVIGVQVLAANTHGEVVRVTPDWAVKPATAEASAPALRPDAPAATPQKPAAEGQPMTREQLDKLRSESVDRAVDQSINAPAK
jgi:S1-C subfamily serine protease